MQSRTVLYKIIRPMLALNLGVIGMECSDAPEKLAYFGDFKSEFVQLAISFFSVLVQFLSFSDQSTITNPIFWSEKPEN